MSLFCILFVVFACAHHSSVPLFHVHIRQCYIPSCILVFYVLCMDWEKCELNGWVSGFVLSSLVVSCLVFVYLSLVLFFFFVVDVV